MILASWLPPLDLITAVLALIAYRKTGEWLYGLLTYVSFVFIATYVVGYLTHSTYLYFDQVSIRWFIIDVGLIGYTLNDLIHYKVNLARAGK